MKMEEKSLNFKEFEEKYLKPFRDLRYIFWPEKGYIVWRMSTGENAELLHVRSFQFGKGYAKELVREMVRQLQKTPPYYSVFGFAMLNKEGLKEIYQNLGFNVTEDIPAPYKERKSFIFFQSYEILKKKYLENRP